MTPTDKICLRLRDLLSQEAKQKLKFCLNTVKLCNKAFMIQPNECISKLFDHMELLLKRIEYLETKPYEEVHENITRYQIEYQNTQRAIIEIKVYMEEL